MDFFCSLSAPNLKMLLDEKTKVSSPPQQKFSISSLFHLLMSMKSQQTLQSFEIKPSQQEPKVIAKSAKQTDKMCKTSLKNCKLEQFVLSPEEQTSTHDTSLGTRQMIFSFANFKAKSRRKGKICVMVFKFSNNKKKCFEVRITLPHGKAGLIFFFKNYKF